MDAGIRGEFTTVGIPSLRPGEVVQVSGFETGRDPSADKFLFNGPYGVVNVRHSVGVGGFTTTFTAFMNFFPKALVEASTDKGVKGDLIKNESIKKSDTPTRPGDSVSISSRDAYLEYERAVGEIDPGSDF